MSRRLTNLLFFSIALFYATLEGYLLVYAIETGKNKTLNIVMIIPLIILVAGLLTKVRIQIAVGVLLLISWIPAGFDNWGLYLFEILLYMILFLLLVRQIAQSKESKLNPLLINFPWLPFMLYIFGALLTWSVSTKIGGELNVIRAMTIIPFALFLVIGLVMRTIKDAELFMWMILTSAAILGILFLFGKNFSGFVTLTNYAAGTGRLSMWLTIPYAGRLEMLPQSTANWFGYLFVFAYSIWLFHRSSLHRTYALFLCLLFGYIILSTQGRGGALQAALGAAVVSVYATFNRKKFGIKGIWIKFALVSLVLLGGFWYLATQSTNEYYIQHGTSLFINPLGDKNLLVRIQGWSNGIKLYLANPILGIGLSGIVTPWGLDTSEILNYFFYNLLSYGLIGFIGIMSILLRLLVSFWRGIRSSDRIIRMICIASIGGMLGFFLGMQPEEPYSTVIVWAPLIIAFTASTLQGNQPILESNLVNEIK